MSLQTGQELPPPLTSKRFAERVRRRIALLIRDPNPIWIRELKQSARLTRTPIILMIVSLLMTLVIASLGGTMSNQEPADKVGVTLFHTYFSIAFFVVTLVGPALAANGVASEREGKTWDAIVLTGLTPQRIARGKFLAAFTAISTYIVVLAPVGALSFLFGGVTASEVAIAFIDLFLIAAVFVSFGLAISAKVGTLRGSIVITLLLAVPLAATLYLVFGLAAADAIHSLWPRVPNKLPVWLPTAYVRGELGVHYVLLLVVIPFVTLIVSMWFCYESTVANLRDDNDDRGFGLKRWYVASTMLITATAVFAEVAFEKSNAEPLAVMSALSVGSFLGFGVVVFAAEPIGPSRRVRAARKRIGQRPLRSFLGPSVANTGVAQIVVGAAAFVVVGAIGSMRMAGSPTVSRHAVPGFSYFVAYELAFFIFLIGLSVWLRARASSAAIARVLLLVTAIGACVLPWVLAAILGVLSRDESGLLVASPSPFYAVIMYQAAGDLTQEAKVAAGLVCLVAWAALGLSFFVAGARRCRDISAESERAALATDQLLASEDEPETTDQEMSATAA